jgi:hypothetical protein
VYAFIHNYISKDLVASRKDTELKTDPCSPIYKYDIAHVCISPISSLHAVPASLGSSFIRVQRPLGYPNDATRIKTPSCCNSPHQRGGFLSSSYLPLSLSLCITCNHGQKPTPPYMTIYGYVMTREHDIDDLEAESMILLVPRKYQWELTRREYNRTFCLVQLLHSIENNHPQKVNQEKENISE